MSGIVIRISKPDRTQTMEFRGNDAPNMAVEKLAEPPPGLGEILLYDGREEHLLSPREALSRLADLYWLQQAG